MLAGRPTGQPAWGDFAPGLGRRSCDRLHSRSSDSRFETLNSVLDPCWTHVGKGSYLGPLGLPGCKTRIGQFRGGSMVSLWWLRSGSGLQNGPVAIPGALQTIVSWVLVNMALPDVHCTRTAHTLRAHCAHNTRTLRTSYAICAHNRRAPSSPDRMLRMSTRARMRTRIGHAHHAHCTRTHSAPTIRTQRAYYTHTLFSPYVRCAETTRTPRAHHTHSHTHTHTHTHTTRTLGAQNTHTTRASPAPRRARSLFPASLVHA